MTGPKRRTGDDVMVLRPPAGRRVLFSLTGLFFVWAIPYNLHRSLTSPAETAAAQQASLLPTWLEWVIVLLLALVGVFAIASSWASKTWVADDWISHRGFTGRARTVRWDEATGIRVKTRGAVSAGTWKSLYVYVDRHTDDEHFSVFLASDFAPIQPVVSTLTEWALRRPSLVTDKKTAQVLGVVPRAQP